MGQFHGPLEGTRAGNVAQAQNGSTVNRCTHKRALSLSKDSDLSPNNVEALSNPPVRHGASRPQGLLPYHHRGCCATAPARLCRTRVGGFGSVGGLGVIHTCSKKQAGKQTRKQTQGQVGSENKRKRENDRDREGENVEAFDILSLAGNSLQPTHLPLPSIFSPPPSSHRTHSPSPAIKVCFSLFFPPFFC
ncbi:hypothetical protein LZ31DRAFT_35640 [Colletotrichum somersetense]|nr:hypothetical protein LZ31DRAFT_35640 [Colletotrichum somersetense]